MSIDFGTKRGSKSKSHNGRSYTSSSGYLLMGVLCGAIFGFYGGFMVASTMRTTTPAMTAVYNDSVKELVDKEVKRILQSQEQRQVDLGDDTALRLPSSLQDTVVGMATVNRDNFMKEFDTGVPLDLSTEQNKDVLLLYQSIKSLPNNAFVAKEAMHQTNLPKIDSAVEATQNCDFLNVILTDHSKRQQCIAIVGQYESFHIQKFMRLPEEKGKLDSKLPLRYVNRGAQSSGRTSTHPATQEETLQYWTILQTYLGSFEKVLEQLRPIVKGIAYQNTVIVLVCNFGQSELLLNFLCNARHRGLDLSHVLVFATDTETRDLLLAFGNHDVNVFYDETNYGAMPKKAAGRYADKTFMAMMMAKVFCVHMVAWMGYDVLFQDVDVIWYKDPLTYFHAPKDSPQSTYDVYFQDDGNHALYYAPYSANTGFYYVRSNERTLNFLNNLLMLGDLIISSHSHQVPLVALLQEHASMFGLRIKIFSRTEDNFPGGHAFHHRRSFMKDITAGRIQPFVFHMSWTNNKDNKIKFFQQLGEWFLQDQCVQKPLNRLPDADHVSESCCAVDPIIKCHFKDKPSKIPCKDSPPIDAGGKSFW